MSCDNGLQIFLLVYSSLLTAIMIAFGIFMCCRKRSSKTVVDSGNSGPPSRRVVSSEMTHIRNIESGVDADQVSVSGNIYANVEDGRDVVYIQDERGMNRMSPSTPLSNLSRSDGMFDMTELHLQDEVEENLYSSAKEDTDSGDTNYEEVISITSKERNSFSSPLQDAKEDLDMLSTISTSSSSSLNSVKNQSLKPIVKEEVEDDNKFDVRNDAVYSNVERKNSSSSSASSTSTMQDNQKIQLDQQNFKYSPNANIPQSNTVDEEDPVALHFQIFNQESYKKRYNSQHDLSRKSSTSSNDEKELMAALGSNIEIDTDQTSQWANKVFNDVEKNFEKPRQDSLSSSEEESLKEEEIETQPRLPDTIQEPSVGSASSSSDEEDGITHHDGQLEAGIRNKKTFDDTDSSSSEDYEVIKSMIKVENDDTEIHYQSSPSENDEDPNHPMESSSEDEENPQPSSSGHHFAEKSHPSTSEEESSSESADSQSMQKVDIKNQGEDDRDIYNGEPLEHPKVTEIKISERKIPIVPDSPVMVRQCTPVYHVSSSSNTSSSDENEEDDDGDEEPIQHNVQPTQNDNLRRSSSVSSSDDEISPKPLKRHPIIDLRTVPSDEEQQLQHNFPPRQVVSLKQSSSLTSDDEEPRQVITIRKSSLSSSDRKSQEKSSSSSSSSSDDEKGPPIPQHNLQSPQVSNLRRNSSGSPSSIFKRLNYDYVSVYTKVELARKKLRDKNYNNVHNEMINDMETDI